MSHHHGDCDTPHLSNTKSLHQDEASFLKFLNETRIIPQIHILKTSERMLALYFREFWKGEEPPGQHHIESSSHFPPHHVQKKLHSLMMENNVREALEYLFFGQWENWRGLGIELKETSIAPEHKTIEETVLWKDEEKIQKDVNKGGGNVIDKIQWLRWKVLRRDFGKMGQMERILRLESDWIGGRWGFTNKLIIHTNTDETLRRDERLSEVEQTTNDSGSSTSTAPDSRTSLSSFAPQFPTYEDRYKDLTDAIQLHDTFESQNRLLQDDVESDEYLSTQDDKTSTANDESSTYNPSFSALLHDIMDPLGVSLHETQIFNPLINSTPHYPTQRELLLFNEEKRNLNSILNNPQISNTDKEKALAAYRQAVFYMLKDEYR